MSIRPLPEEVVAQIKSSTAIVSLSGVVLELLKNSLDAKATRVVVNVDFARGGCVVEDDGLGIPPAEFSEDGGLGKRYWTSKFHSEQSYLGQHGTFLASLSAVSLLNITSHHHAYRSHNSISFHHAQTIARQMPAPLHNQIHGQNGTRVTVRNLFGNMPVRVKQRAMIVDQKAEQHRLRYLLKKEVVSLLLSWQGLIALKICDGDGNTIVHVNTSNTATTGGSRSAASEGRTAHLSHLLQVMTQANLIDIDDWTSWVPASASTSAISVKGAISLEPAPTKHIQFISIGQRPLSSERGGNELYDQVNRLFALSSFGTIEDDADVDEQEKVRRLSDKRFKREGYTNRQLRARKGVERYPKFHLRVALRDKELLEGAFVEDESNLQAVVDVFAAMIVQWLSVHHFRPEKSQQISDRAHTASPVSEGQFELSLTPSRKRQPLSGSPASSSTPDSAGSLTKATKKQRLVRESSRDLLGRSRSQAFANWSRIKSGRSGFFDIAGPNLEATTSEVCQELDRPQILEGSDHLSPGDGPEQSAAFHIAPVTKGALGGLAMTAPLDVEFEDSSAVEDKDETITWVDRSTKRTHYLNARTGCMVPCQRPRTDPAALSPSTTRMSTSRSLRMGTKPATAEPLKTVWLDELLRNWDNPVFKTSEHGIQQISLQNNKNRDDTQNPRHSHLRCSHFDMQKAFNDAGLTSTKLSKDALHRAEVIRQVDKKFILVRMTRLATELNAQMRADTLVLIDQHAADERVQVESLLHELCSPVHGVEQRGSQSIPRSGSSVAQAALDKPLHFAISSRERSHFETFKVAFAAWSILYNISSAVSLEHGTDVPGNTCKLTITALPPSISERCKADPELLISFLRSALWKYVDSPPLPSAAIDDSDTGWVKKLATCPPGLVDMINSRACRSAIMFNDELSLEDCRALVSKLANCVFPFMCAHGRPSMVPIVDMDRVSGSAHTEEESSGLGFVDAWKAWKRS